jgi:hypothetical protein
MSLWVLDTDMLTLWLADSLQRQVRLDAAHYLPPRKVQLELSGILMKTRSQTWK